jgi:hypothetical protein
MKKLVAEIEVQKNSVPSGVTFRGQSFRVMSAERAGRLVEFLKRKYPCYSQELPTHTYYQFWTVE